MSWWVLLQTWSTLHFDDHCGLLPAEMVVDETGLATKLTRSQVSGLDKQQSLRQVVVAAEAYVQHRYWLTSGWKILCGAAPYERLLPEPTSNCKGCRQAKLQYQHSFRGADKVAGSRCISWTEAFPVHTRHYYHAQRDGVLQFGKAERDLLGGWSSDGSERYTRVARHRITFMQQSVANTFRRGDVMDPLAESDDIDALVDFLETPDIPEIASSWRRPSRTGNPWRRF